MREVLEVLGISVATCGLGYWNFSVPGTGLEVGIPAKAFRELWGCRDLSTCGPLPDYVENLTFRCETRNVGTPCPKEPCPSVDKPSIVLLLLKG